jgi:hypothetical protein
MVLFLFRYKFEIPFPYTPPEHGGEKGDSDE